MCYIYMSFLWNPPEKVVPAQKEKCNDGHCYDHHDYIGHVPGYMGTVLPRQDVGSRAINPGCDSSDDNYVGTRCLYGSSATNIALVNISGSFYGDCHTVRYVLIGT